jgi:transcriptional regulator with XRE-family HTH domain
VVSRNAVFVGGRAYPLMAKASRKKPERLAEKLLEIRQKLGLSQNGMIRHLDLTEELEQDYISKFERGVLVPPLHILLAYAEAANVWVEVLIKDSLDLPESLPSHGKKSEGVRRDSTLNAIQRK